jgi:cysteine synthase A
LSSNIYEGTSGFYINILGSTGISLTLMANSLGKNCHIYLPNDMAEEKYKILEICNA